MNDSAGWLAVALVCFLLVGCPEPDRRSYEVRLSIEKDACGKLGGKFNYYIKDDRRVYVCAGVK